MKKKIFSMLKTRLIPGTFGYGVVLLWVVFTAMIIGWVFFASLSTTGEIFFGKLFKFETGLHFENYVKAWRVQQVSLFFMNSILYTVVTCVGVILVAAPAAYALSRFRFSGNAIVQNIFAAALSISGIMIILPLFGLASTLRLTNNRWVLMFLYIGMNIPFAVFFLQAFFRNLSYTYEEAAAIDGCSPVKTFWRIILPLAQPGLVTLTIFCFIGTWNEFFMGLIFANRPNVRPVAVGLYNMIASMQWTSDWGGMFASVIIVVMPTFLLYVFLSEKIVKGLTAGAIKG